MDEMKGEGGQPENPYKGLTPEHVVYLTIDACRIFAQITKAEVSGQNVQEYIETNKDFAVTINYHAHLLGYLSGLLEHEDPDIRLGFAFLLSKAYVLAGMMHKKIEERLVLQSDYSIPEPDTDVRYYLIQAIGSFKIELNRDLFLDIIYVRSYALSDKWAALKVLSRRAGGDFIQNLGVASEYPNIGRLVKHTISRIRRRMEKWEKRTQKYTTVIEFEAARLGILLSDRLDAMKRAKITRNDFPLRRTPVKLVAKDNRESCREQARAALNPIERVRHFLGLRRA